jgi:hypothetical protein
MIAVLLFLGLVLAPLLSYALDRLLRRLLWR